MIRLLGYQGEVPGEVAAGSGHLHSLAPWGPSEPPPKKKKNTKQKMCC